MRGTIVRQLPKPSRIRQFATPVDNSAGTLEPPSRRRTRPSHDPSTGKVVPSQVGLAAASLLPGLPLYRRILRVHKLLPLEMKSMGDSYVKDEFRRHANVENPLHVIGFLKNWKVYLDELEANYVKDAADTGPTAVLFSGRKLDSEQFEKLSDDQLYQLHELMNVAKELYDPEKAQSQPPGGNQAINDAVEDALNRAKKSGNDDNSGGEKR